MNRVLPFVIALITTIPALVPSIFLLSSGVHSDVRPGFILLTVAIVIGAFAHLAMIRLFHRPEPVPVRVTNK